MNEDEMEALEPQAGRTLERTLSRYARVRLDPSPAQSRHARAAVMEEAWRRRFELADAAAGIRSEASDARAVRAARTRRLPFAGWGVRRLSGALSAAVLAGLLIGSTAFATSRAGGPLYEARISLEELTLPADPASRVEAEIALAQARLAEIVEASSRDDGRALAAALAAYERSIGILGATTGEGAARAMEAVTSHVAVLERVAAQAPAAAQNGLDHARSASDKVIDELAAAEDAWPGASGGATSGNGAGSGGSGGKGNGIGSADSPTAEPTVKPGRTPPPKPTRAPANP